jgi:hypothetical protein
MNEVPDFEEIPEGVKKRIEEQRKNPPKTMYHESFDLGEAPPHMWHLPTPESLNARAKHFGVLIEVISDFIKSKTGKSSDTKK